MTYYKELFDVITGELTKIELTQEEITLRENEIEKNRVEAEAIIKRAADKAALLQRLGLTEDEARLLLS